MQSLSGPQRFEPAGLGVCNIRGSAALGPGGDETEPMLTQFRVAPAPGPLPTASSQSQSQLIRKDPDAWKD